MERIRIEAELLVDDPEEWNYDAVSALLEGALLANEGEKIDEVIVRSLGKVKEEEEPKDEEIPNKNPSGSSVRGGGRGKRGGRSKK